jgi:hypothetical protein
MILTFEYNAKGVVEVFMDEAGRDLLIQTMRNLSATETGIDHSHLMTPAWAGIELTEQLQNSANELINKVTVFLVRDHA